MLHQCHGTQDHHSIRVSTRVFAGRRRGAQAPWPPESLSRIRRSSLSRSPSS
jgi:hypothetical protein